MIVEAVYRQLLLTPAADANAVMLQLLCVLCTCTLLSLNLLLLSFCNFEVVYSQIELNQQQQH